MPKDENHGEYRRLQPAPSFCAAVFSDRYVQPYFFSRPKVRLYGSPLMCPLALVSAYTSLDFALIASLFFAVYVVVLCLLASRCFSDYSAFDL